MAVRVLGHKGANRTDLLREAMVYAHSEFPSYRRVFDEVALTLSDISSLDPISILERLPILISAQLNHISNEGFLNGNTIVDIETSSGTTGTRKKRAITPTDEENETKLLARLFDTCGIGTTDSIACLDTGPLTLMVSFIKAFETLGAREVYAYCASPDVNTTVKDLINLNPTVVVTIPSIIEKYLPELIDHFGGSNDTHLRAIVYVGEPMADDTRSVLQEEMGLEVVSYYGTSETSALGIECHAHDGVHLFTDQNLIELVYEEAEQCKGEILVTTLRQKGLPLLRYALKDVVTVKGGDCRCGLNFPRVEVLGRSDGSASILGVNISFEAIRNAAYHVVGKPGPMKVVLDRDGQEHMTILLPNRLRKMETSIRKSLLASETDLAYLSGSQFLKIHLSFVNDNLFSGKKRLGIIVDSREPISPAR